MSYNRTVRCGHCWQKGHNRTTCKKLLDTMTARLKDDPDDLYAQRFFKSKEKRKGKKKSCGYCDGQGHQRRTCLELKHAKKVAIKECVAWRKRLIEAFKTQGVGIGTLVRYERYSEARLGIITEVHWDRLDHRIQYDSHPREVNSLVTKDTANFTSYYGACVLPIPEAEGVYTRQEFYSGVSREFVGSINQAEVESQVPEDFLTGESCIEPIFQDGAKSQDRTAAWQVQDWCPLQGFYKESEN